MSTRSNIMKSIHFEHPDYIPMTFKINDSCWEYYPQEELFELMEAHPFLFPTFQRPAKPYHPSLKNVARKDFPYRDDWGCLWTTTMDGITGTVTEHPLSSWEGFKNYHAPDPETCMGIGSIDWKQERQKIQQKKQKHLLTKEGLRHGHTFLQLCDIRGYENLIYDMTDEEPNLPLLISMVEDFNQTIIQKYLSMDVDLITYPEDLGMQTGPMLSPHQFLNYIYPSYKKLMEPAFRKGIPIHMHSDGDIRLLTEALLSLPISVLNLQDLVNGLDWIKKNLCGRICIELDIDRQVITPYHSPKQIRELIRSEVTSLGSKQGGLMMIYGLYPGVPLENINSLMNAMEDYAFYYT